VPCGALVSRCCERNQQRQELVREQPNDWLQYSLPEALRATPVPKVSMEQDMMLERWPEEHIQARATARALVCPAAMFSAIG